jgi:hypothetical protein
MCDNASQSFLDLAKGVVLKKVKHLACFLSTLALDQIGVSALQFSM